MLIYTILYTVYSTFEEESTLGLLEKKNTFDVPLTYLNKSLVQLFIFLKEIFDEVKPLNIFYETQSHN